MNHDHDHPQKRSTLNYVFIGFVAIAAFFLLSEHRAHVLGILPYLLLAACPLMHFFGHGHGGHGSHGEKESKPERQSGDKNPESPEHSHH